MKTIENQGVLTTPNAMGRSVPVKTPAVFQIANEINGFEHVSYGTAPNLEHSKIGLNVRRLVKEDPTARHRADIHRAARIAQLARSRLSALAFIVVRIKKSL